MEGVGVQKPRPSGLPSRPSPPRLGGVGEGSVGGEGGVGFLGGRDLSRAG